MTDKIQKISEEVEKRYEYWREKESNSHSIESEIRMSECKHLLLMLDSLQEEPVSEELEEAANNAVISLIPSFCQKNSDGSYVSSYRDCFKREEFINLFMAGAKWKEHQMIAKAIDGKVIANGMGKPILHLWDKGKHLIDKKVKVILIKED